MNRLSMLEHRHNKDFTWELGVDESGRGTLIGSVFIAAVMFPQDIQIPKEIVLNDSKKLSHKRRAKAREWIEANALKWHVASRDAEYIDKHNIWMATLSGMNECIMAVIGDTPMDEIHAVIDGNRFIPEDIDMQFTTIEKADAKYLHVASASILAKEHHDDHIKALLAMDQSFDKYCLSSNMGYGTLAHRTAIMEHGCSQWHRKSFKPCSDTIPKNQASVQASVEASVQASVQAIPRKVFQKSLPVFVDSSEPVII